MHLSFHHRVTGDAAGANRDLCYVKWDGTNWKKADGTAQTVPITSSNDDVVDDTSGENLGLTSTNSLYSDSDGHPHIIYPKTASSVRNMYHAYHNGSTWTITQLTATANASLGDNNDGLTGLQAAIAIDRSTDTVYAFYTNPRVSAGLLMQKSTDFTTWTKKEVYPYNVGWYSPKYDYREFERSGNLYFSVEEYHGNLLTSNQTSFPICIWKVNPGVL